MSRYSTYGRSRSQNLRKYQQELDEKAGADALAAPAQASSEPTDSCYAHEGMHGSHFAKVWGAAGGGDAGRAALAEYAFNIGKRAAQPEQAKPTDISKRLREELANAQWLDTKLWAKAVDEIERLAAQEAKPTDLQGKLRESCDPEDFGVPAQYAKCAHNYAAFLASQEAKPTEVRGLTDAARLDFVLDRSLFICTIPASKSGAEGYQLMEQDEDEDYQVVSGEGIAYRTKREAVDAAIANMSGATAAQNGKP